MTSSTQIEISKSALQHNLEFIRSVMVNGARYSSVVKGNAYGHGIELFVPLAEEVGVDHFSVFNAEEALRVSKVSEHGSTIMIMGMLTHDQLEWAIENEVEFFVFEVDRLLQAIGLARRLGKRARVHIEVETGMNRTGFPTNELEGIVKMVSANMDHIEICGVCSHLAGAESIANYYRLKRQNERFKRIVSKLGKLGLSPKYRHLACSAASIRYPKTQLDLVRIGILQYGFFPNQETLIHYLTQKREVDAPLHRILSWKSRVMSTKRVKRGEFVGYGTSFFANSDMQIATIPIGYSHGFARSLSNQGRVIIRGQFTKVVGIVNMNMISVDVSEIPSVETGDEVVIIGHQGDKEITVSSFSDFSNQVNYELLTRLPSEIPRLVVRSSGRVSRLVAMRKVSLVAFVLSLFCLTTFAQDSIQDQLNRAALELTEDRVEYDPTYFSIDYPNGDVPADKGVCTDVVIRAYRKLGIDLQQLVHEDMAANFSAYPRNWGLSKPDSNIDHRRVPNLMTFFTRKGASVPVSDNPDDYLAGDVVAWDLGNGLKHIGVVVNSAGSKPLIVHNIGSGQVLEDCLFSFRIIGHFRYPKK